MVLLTTWRHLFGWHGTVWDEGTISFHPLGHLPQTRLLQAPPRKGVFPSFLPLPSPCSPSPARSPLGPSPRPSGPGRSWGRSRPWSLRRRLHFRAAPRRFRRLSREYPARGTVGNVVLSPPPPVFPKSGTTIKAFHCLYIPAESCVVLLLISVL